jgi:hypothetical protein
VGYGLRVNGLLKHVIEGNIERALKRGTKLQQVLHDLKGKKMYWDLKQEALDWRELAVERLWRLRSE